MSVGRIYIFFCNVYALFKAYTITVEMGRKSLTIAVFGCANYASRDFSANSRTRYSYANHYGIL